MRSWHWKAAFSLLVYLVFIYTVLQTPNEINSAMEAGSVFFTNSHFFMIFPLIFLLNSPVSYTRNSMFLLRLQNKARVFIYEMKKMTLYSLIYVMTVTVFLIVASLLVNAHFSLVTVGYSLSTNLVCALLLSGFVVVGSMYVRYQIALIAVYSVTLIMIILPEAMFFDQFTPFDFIYFGTSFNLRDIRFYILAYAAYFVLIGLLYFLYDIFGKRDLS